MTQTRQAGATDDIGLSTFEQADPSARSVEVEMPDILVFDTDSKRMGDYGGFFLAEDCGAANYNVPDAPGDPKARERVNGPKNRIPGVHLPEKVHFALCAAGPLFTVSETTEDRPKDVFHFEAIVFCREVIDKRTKGPALLKLTAKGPAAVKIHHFLTLGISDPIQRMNEHYHGLAKTLLAENKITRERHDHILQQQATAQMLWAPVEIKRGVQIGRSEEKSVTGCMVYTDEPEGGRSKKYKSRWPLIETSLLVTPDTQGGLLLTGEVQKFCQENRARYVAALAARASFKGQVQEQTSEEGTDSAQSSATPSEATSATSQRSPATRALQSSAAAPAEDNKTRLLREAREGLKAIGKSEHDKDVKERMSEFGSDNLQGFSEVQLSAFNDYVQGFARRQADKKKKTSSSASTRAA